MPFWVGLGARRPEGELVMGSKGGGESLPFWSVCWTCWLDEERVATISAAEGGEDW